jgi:hypothetical protein
LAGCRQPQVGLYLIRREVRFGRGTAGPKGHAVVPAPNLSQTILAHGLRGERSLEHCHCDTPVLYFHLPGPVSAVDRGAQAHPVLPALQIFRQRLSYRSGLLDQRLWIQLSVATKRNWAYIRVAGKCVVMTAGPQGHVVVPAPLLPRRYLRTDSAASVPAPLHFFDIKNAVDELSQDRGAPVQPGKIAR